MSKRWEGKTGKVFAKVECNIDLESVVSCLGEEHFIENDPSRTASGTERFWVFDIGNNFALAFQYSDISNHLLVGTNNKGAIHAKLLQRFISFPTTQTVGLMWE